MQDTNIVLKLWKKKIMGSENISGANKYVYGLIPHMDHHRQGLEMQMRLKPQVFFFQYFIYILLIFLQ